MGTVGDCFDNSMAESFFATLQTELIDRRSWATRQELGQAIFEYVEPFYNPIRRHSSLEMLSPNCYEHRRHDGCDRCGMMLTATRKPVRETGGTSKRTTIRRQPPESGRLRNPNSIRPRASAPPRPRSP